MRTENIKVTFKIPIPVDKPDLNGVIYSKEAIRNAYKNVKNVPIEMSNCCGRQCNNEMFILPIRKYEEDRTYCVADSDINLCEEYKKKIAGLIDNIRFTNKEHLKMIGKNNFWGLYVLYVYRKLTHSNKLNSQYNFTFWVVYLGNGY